MAEIEWVEVLVPKHLVPRVYGLISDEMSTGQPSNGTATSGSSTQVSAKRMFLESPPAMKHLLLTLAGSPGEEHTSQQLCEALDLAPAQLAGVLGAFGRRRKNRYKGTRKPFHAAWNHADETWQYRMDANVADEIHAAAESDEE